MSADSSGRNAPGIPGQVESVGDVQRENNVLAGQELQQTPEDFWIGLAERAEIVAAAQQKTAAYAQQQYAQLSTDIETQSAPNFSGHNYSAYTATQLKQMVTTNMDPTTAGSAASTWTDIGNKYVDVAQSLSQATSNSEYGWQGTAGDATRDFIGGIAKWAGTAGQGAQLAGNRLAVQSEAASTAKNSVPTSPTEPPTASDVVSTMLQSGFNPATGAAKLNAQFSQAAADHAEAVQAAQTYDTSLASSGEKFPAFNAPPTFNPAAGGGASLPSSGGGGVSGLSSAGNAPRANAGVRGTSSAGARGSSGSGQQLAATSPSNASGAPNLSTGQSGFDPGMTTPPGTGNPDVNVPSQGNPGGGNNIDPRFSGSLLGELGATGGGGALGGPSSGGGLGAGAGALRGLSGGAAGEGGTAARSGVGAGVAGEEGEGGLGMRGGATGESGQSGMMPRGGRGKGGEDAEHRRPDYLLNADPDATFGSDERVSPPVIGE